MSTSPSMPVSARLATWATAWLCGDVPFDSVLEALARSNADHLVVGLPVAVGARVEASVPAAEQLAPQPVGAALIAWRRATRVVRVVLPAAGDARGLPPATDFARAAIEAGQGVLGGGLGLVPSELVPSERVPSERVPSEPVPAPGGARPIVTWQAFAVDEPRPDPLSLTDATYELAAAMRETARLFSARDLSGSRTDVTEALARARRAGEHLDLPAGYPPRAVALGAQAERLAAVVAIATGDSQGGSVDRSGMSDRADALRALAGVVRRARQAAYNATAD